MPATTALRTVADQVCDLLRNELFAGTHPVGMALREEQLAQRFGVSRHPIRKVFQQLTLEGLLTARPNCGVVVAGGSDEHVAGLLTPLRKQLELYALQQALPLLTAEHRIQWEAIIKRMHRAVEDKSPQELLNQDAAFHQMFLIAAGLEEMIPVWQGIYGRMREFHRQGNSQLTDLRVVPFIHERLLKSILSDNFEKACVDLASHLENTDFNNLARSAFQIQYPTVPSKGYSARGPE
jgi:DNA-binding GntR family transcriptional regulator